MGRKNHYMAPFLEKHVILSVYIHAAYVVLNCVSQPIWSTPVTEKELEIKNEQ